MTRLRDVHAREPGEQRHARTMRPRRPRYVRAGAIGIALVVLAAFLSVVLSEVAQ